MSRTEWLRSNRPVLPINAAFFPHKTMGLRWDVVYDELAILDDYEGVDITRLTREIELNKAAGRSMDDRPRFIDEPQKSVVVPLNVPDPKNKSKS